MKKYLVLILVLSMLLSLFACGNKTEETESAGESESSSESTSGEGGSGTDGSTEGIETEDNGSNSIESNSTESNSTESNSTESNSTESNNTDSSGSETEDNTEEKETNVLNDGLASVMPYEKYNLDTYMLPIWDGKVVHNETVMFVGIGDKAPLLYDADRIISVRSYDLKTEYVQGIDYDYVDGNLILLEGTRIPYVPLDTYYSVLDPEYPYLSTMYNGQVTQTMFGDGDAMTKWQVAVTYKHSDTWEGKVVESYPDRYADFINKLENGEDVTVFFYGDSITTGATSSQSRAPYAPSFARMFVQYVAKQYGYTVKYVDTYSDFTTNRPSGGTAHDDTVFGNNGIITYINTAVGGWSTKNGLDNYAQYVGKYIATYGCDLFVLAFGMNNGGSQASDVCNLLEQILRSLYRSAPQTDVVLVSTMIPNPEAVRNPADKYYCNGNQYTFEAEMYPMAERINANQMNCAVAPMTSVSQYIHSQKRYRDTTGNNVNHPSDFLARTYAQVIYQTVFGYENLDNGAIEFENKPAVDVNFNAEMTVSGNTVYLDGAGGTTNKNYAACVRFENVEGGYHMYFVKDFARVYVNVENGSIFYSGIATSLWTYDESAASVTSGGVSVKLSAPEICLHPIIMSDSGHGNEPCIRCRIKASGESHSMADSTVENADGSTTYINACSQCGKIGSIYTVPQGVIYYSGSAISNSPIFYLLNGNLQSENGVGFTRITPKTSNHGHELHWIDQNNEPHNDYLGKQLDTKGARYLVIRLRASHAEIKMEFKYRLLESNTGHYAVPAVKAGEWVTYVLDLKALGGNNYAELADGTYTMQYFKMFFGAGFDQIENGYVDFEYLALCDSFDQIAEIANSETVQIMTTAGNVSEMKSDGTCTGEHSFTETVKGNTYTSACAICGTVIASKTVPEGVNYFASAYALSEKANGANLINYAEVINDEEGAYCRIYGGAAHATQNYNQFGIYASSSATNVTGQYFVIKYRVGENGLGQKKVTIYAGTENVGPSSEAERIDLYVGDGTTVEDGTWHIAIINMDTAAGIGNANDLFKAGDDGLFRAKFVSIRPFYTGNAGGDEGDYMDIAFAALCDSLEEAEAIVESGSYEYYTDSSMPTVVNITQ